MLIGAEHSETLVEFARLYNARQIFLPRLIAKGWERLSRKSLVMVSLARDMEVTNVADRRRART